MSRQGTQEFAPGVSVLGGAAGGLSYEGMMRDAVAHEERSRRQEAGRSRLAPKGQAAKPAPQAQIQSPQPKADHARQARIAGR